MTEPDRPHLEANATGVADIVFFVLAAISLFYLRRSGVGRRVSDEPVSADRIFRPRSAARPTERLGHAAISNLSANSLGNPTAATSRATASTS